MQEGDGSNGEKSGTLQSKKRALVGQKDRLRLLKKMQTGKERVQRKMEQGRSGKGGDLTQTHEKPVARDVKYVPVMRKNLDPLCNVFLFS